MKKIIFNFIFFFYKYSAFYLFKILRNPPESLLLEKSSWKSENKSILFHASSVGELEVLTPVIEACVQDGVLVHVSIFSPSALWALEKLYKKLNKNRCGYFGFSPKEGEWKTFLKKCNPTILMTDRYEAWPDLWLSLSELHIPLYIIGAQTRKSILFIKNIFHFFKIPLPEIYFFTSENQFIEELKNHFPQACFLTVGELRLDRIAQRMNIYTDRVKFLKEWIIFQSDQKPIIVLGSIWSDDFKQWKHLIDKYKNSYCFILAPHKIENDFIDEINKYFKIYSESLVFTSTLENKMEPLKLNKTGVILLDEMGVLLEIYSLAHMVYIGGGFSSGIHNTLEPAASLVPVACGLKNHEKFPEIQFLRKNTQLTFVENAEDIEKWILLNSHSYILKNKDRWAEQLNNRRGAKNKILDEIKKAFVENKSAGN